MEQIPDAPRTREAFAPFDGIAAIPSIEKHPLTSPKADMPFNPTRQAFEHMVKALRADNDQFETRLGWLILGPRTEFIQDRPKNEEKPEQHCLVDGKLMSRLDDPSVTGVALLVDQTRTWTDVAKFIIQAQEILAQHPDKCIFLAALNSIEQTLCSIQAFRINPTVTKQTIDELLLANKAIVADYQDRHDLAAKRITHSLKTGPAQDVRSQIDKIVTETKENCARFIADKFKDSSLSNRVAGAMHEHLASEKILALMASNKTSAYAVSYTLQQIKFATTLKLFLQPLIIEPVNIPNLLGVISTTWHEQIDLLTTKEISNDVKLEHELHEHLVSNLVFSAGLGAGARVLRPLIEACAQIPAGDEKDVGKATGKDDPTTEYTSALLKPTLDCMKEASQSLAEYAVLRETGAGDLESDYLVSLAIARHLPREKLYALMQTELGFVPITVPAKDLIEVMHSLTAGSVFRTALGITYQMEVKEFIGTWTGHSVAELQHNTTLLTIHDASLSELFHRLLAGMHKQLTQEQGKLVTMTTEEARQMLVGNENREQRKQLKQLPESEIATKTAARRNTVEHALNMAENLIQVISPSSVITGPQSGGHDALYEYAGTHVLVAEENKTIRRAVEKRAINYRVLRADSAAKHTELFSTAAAAIQQVLVPVTETVLTNFELAAVTLRAQTIVMDIAFVQASENQDIKAELALRITKLLKSAPAAATSAEASPPPTPPSAADQLAIKNAQMNTEIGLAHDLALARHLFGERSAAARVVENVLAERHPARAEEIELLAEAYEAVAVRAAKYFAPGAATPTKV